MRRRYYELASQYHPDKVHLLGPKLRELAEIEMKTINEAYIISRVNTTFRTLRGSSPKGLFYHVQSPHIRIPRT